MRASRLGQIPYGHAGQCGHSEDMRCVLSAAVLCAGRLENSSQTCGEVMEKSIILLLWQKPTNGYRMAPLSE